MRKAMEYVNEAKTIDQAYEMIDENAIEDIAEWVQCLDDGDLLNIVEEFNGDIYYMDCLDDEFEWMSVTEVLEELSDIDTHDDYFNKDSRTSSCDIWELIDEDSEDIARKIYYGEIYVRDGFYPGLERITDEIYRIKAEVEKKFNQYEQARKLFEQMMKEDPEETMNILWNSRA